MTIALALLAGILLGAGGVLGFGFWQMKKDKGKEEVKDTLLPKLQRAKKVNRLLNIAENMANEGRHDAALSIALSCAELMSEKTEIENES